MKTYKGKILGLKPNEIFVFGSNPAGINGNLQTGKGGSALFAQKMGWVENGERMNNCLSKCGKSWGIVTVTYPGRRKSVSLEGIKDNIIKLYEYAKNNPDKVFLIAYTGTSGYNLNGWSNVELASCFSGYVPDNIVFEEKFNSLVVRY
jgi:hypothetical protein